jgi:hypothetical protein
MVFRAFALGLIFSEDPNPNTHYLYMIHHPVKKNNFSGHTISTEREKNKEKAIEV